MSSQMIFEHPLNERIRTFLRLEHLFEKVEYFAPRPEHWNTRAGIEGLLDIVVMTARADVKAELLKEIDRNLSTLARISDQPGVDPSALSGVLSELEQAASGIHDLKGPIGADARENEFLKSISQRSAIPGGACSFDLPAYHYLLTQSADVRAERMQQWLEPMRPVSKAIGLVLSLARTSANPRKLVAEGAFFQEALDPQAPAQLVRVGIEPELSVFPEISGHKNRFSIRFLHANGVARPRQLRDDVEFTLTCCVF
ncbi:MAG TPA: cell division protein ZapD [Chromatiaceae bacterium]|nr:MAG: cell division protein ZapD [Thiohalocapsa sp. PB-PSB1]HBG96745.1 cell division protein ZapD [Chromatiaceae bacterium]HCS90415.1 cell division protein ZapD [Chromatiaceae bacterium]